MNTEVLIGRAASSDIKLSDDTVSRTHAKMYRTKNGEVFIEDLNSTNGTFVNGERINKPVQITLDDELRFGASTLAKRHYDFFFQNRVQALPTTKSFFERYGLIAATVSAILLVTIVFWMVDETREDIQIPPEKQEQEMVSADSNEKQEQPKDTAINDAPPSDQPATAKEDIIETPVFKRRHETIEYSLSCLRSQSSLDELIGLGAEIQDGFIEFASDEVGVEEEIKVGKAVYDDVREEYGFLDDDVLLSRINKIADRLIKAMDEKRMEYEFYLIEDEDINAFTAGGKVFVTSEMMNFVKSDDELAAVLAHEIYHNELGHINKLIRKEQIAHDMLGELSDWGLLANAVLGASFNRENEAYCDMYGVDLMILAGYDGRQAAHLWERMESGSESDTEKLFSTHPFSSERINCINDHIERNYDVVVRDVNR